MTPERDVVRPEHSLDESERTPERALRQLAWRRTPASGAGIYTPSRGGGPPVPFRAPRSTVIGWQLRVATVGASMVTAAASALVLLGWALNSPRIESLYLSQVTVKANTALGLGLAAIALYLLGGGTRRGHREPTAGRANTVRTGIGRALAGCVLAGLVVLLGATTASEYLFRVDLGIDRLLFAATAEAARTSTPGRMAMITAVEFVLLGSGLLLQEARSRHLRRCAGPALGATAALALIALLGYAYGAIPMAGIGQGYQIAVPTAAAFVMLAAGALARRPDEGFVHTIVSDRPGGILARRLLPFAFGVPVCLGAVRAAGPWAGAQSPATVSAAVAVMTMLALGAMIWWTARVVDGADAQRQAADAERVRLLVDRQAALTRAAAEHEAREVADHAREALAAQRRFLRQIIDMIPNFVFATDRTGCYTLANQAVTDAHGARTEAVVGMPEAEFGRTPEEMADQHRANLGVMDTLAARSVPEERITDAAGAARYLYTVKRPIVGQDGRSDQVLTVATDITDRKRLEAQLLQAQKMEAIGRLAGGIAHDFNNLLTVIKSCCSLAVDVIDPGTPVAEEILEIQRTTDRAAALTGQLLAFSRTRVVQPKALDLNGVVGGVEKMVRRLIGEDIDLVFTSASDLWQVSADPGHIEQAIVNLVVNARDAMPDGGQITIVTANVDLTGGDDGYYLGVPPGRYVMLALSDTGTGMSPETQARIFEPFFTTKAVGKGTGLGLSTVYGIVKQSGGEMRVYSEVGHGTSFKMYLPCLDEAVAERAPDAPAALHGTDGDATILLIEDEDAVRTVAARVLRRAGYTVIEAVAEDQALAACDPSGPAIDLVLTDLVMPGMGGRALANEIRGRRPGIRVLFMSGYTSDAVMRHRVLDQTAAFIEKPFAAETLLGKVREMLVGTGV